MRIRPPYYTPSFSLPDSARLFAFFAHKEQGLGSFRSSNKICCNVCFYNMIRHVQFFTKFNDRRKKITGFIAKINCHSAQFKMIGYKNASTRAGHTECQTVLSSGYPDSNMIAFLNHLVFNPQLFSYNLIIGCNFHDMPNPFLSPSLAFPEFNR